MRGPVAALERKAMRSPSVFMIPERFGAALETLFIGCARVGRERGGPETCASRQVELCGVICYFGRLGSLCERAAATFARVEMDSAGAARWFGTEVWTCLGARDKLSDWHGVGTAPGSHRNACKSSVR
jgi:hypothetical protein